MPTIIRVPTLIQNLTLFRMGGGHYGPDSWNQSAVSTRLEIGSPKFMTLFLSRFARSYESHFLKKIILFLAEYELYMFSAIF